MIKIGPQAQNQFARSIIAPYAWVLPTRPWLQLKINFNEKNVFVSYKICIQVIVCLNSIFYKNK